MATDDIHYLELTELTRRMHAKQLSPVEATQAMLSRIAAVDGKLHSYALVTAETALAEARQAEAEIARGAIKGPLHGAPIAVKDLCWTKGVATAAGMTIYHDYKPTADATVVRRLRDAGAIILGKLQLTEGAYVDHHPKITPPVNPWGAEYLVGRVIFRLGCRHGRGAMLRIARIRHWRIDPLPLGGPRTDRAETHLGPCQPLWRLRACRDAGSYRTDDAQRRGCGRDAGRHRRAGRERSHRIAGSRSRTMWQTSVAGCAACASASTQPGFQPRRTRRRSRWWMPL